MKKIFTLLLMVVMSLTILAGCGDPLYDDLENFINTEMTEVSDNYQKIRTEASNWETFEEYDEIKTSINDTLLPLVNDSLEKLEKINPETDEVKELKDKFVEIMEAYKEGFNDILDGCNEEDEAKLTAGQEKITNGLELLNEYNTDLEELAGEVGLEVEY